MSSQTGPNAVQLGTSFNRRRMLAASTAAGATLVAPAFLTAAQAACTYTPTPSAFFNSSLKRPTYLKVMYCNFLDASQRVWVAYPSNTAHRAYAVWQSSTSSALYSIGHGDSNIFCNQLNKSNGTLIKNIYDYEGDNRELPEAFIPDRVKGFYHPNSKLISWGQSVIAGWMGWMEFTYTGNPRDDRWFRLWVYDKATKVYRVVNIQVIENGVSIKANLDTVQKFLQTHQLCVKDFNSAVSQASLLGLAVAFANAVWDSLDEFQIGAMGYAALAFITLGRPLYQLMESISSYSSNLFTQVSSLRYIEK